MADRVEQRRALQAARHEELEARVVELLAPFAGDERALDVGCGTGALAYVLAAHVGEVVGVDSSEAYVEAARAHAPPRCTFAMKVGCWNSAPCAAPNALGAPNTPPVLAPTSV